MTVIKCLQSSNTCFERLNQNNDAGNQYILELNLPRAIRTQLGEDKNALQGIASRFMFDGITCLQHDTPNRRPSDNILIHSFFGGTSRDHMKCPDCNLQTNCGGKASVKELYHTLPSSGCSAYTILQDLNRTIPIRQAKIQTFLVQPIAHYRCNGSWNASILLHVPPQA